MTLRSYLKKRGMTQAAMAAKLGVRHPVLTRWLSGHVPKTEFVQRIHRATRGQVSLFDWQIPDA